MNKKEIPAGAATLTEMKTKSLAGDFNSNASTPLPENTSAAAQRSAILKHLQAGNMLTTIHAREAMGIMHPGGP
jgi:imidazolonepropionase-like amidohydrolase